MGQNNFSNNLKILRKYYHLSQTQLGEIVGKTHSAISRWEAELREPQDKDIQAFCNHFGVEASELMYGDLWEVLGNNSRNREKPLIAVCRKLTDEQFTQVFDLALELLASSSPDMTIAELTED